MSARRWSKFWWQDWQRDPALRMCSPAARGIWMDMLAIMHDAEPCGHLLVNGRAPNTKQLSLIFGVSEKEGKKLIAELEENGVFSRSDCGVIFNRRMVRDKAVSDEAVANGKKGGNPKIIRKEKPTDNPNKNKNDKRGLTPPVNPNPRGGVNHQEAEAEADTDKPSLRSGPPEPVAEPDQPVDARTMLFREGKTLLHHMTGKPEAQCGNLIGRWLKTCRDRCDLLLSIIREAAEHRPADVVSWIEGAVKHRTSNGLTPRHERVAEAWAGVPDIEGV
ncbi:winged helix-turn-helix domain-containing protein [Acetobacter okinawensis]|uniref:winged helix-turn-helix domain-containing protein n=1 Tax=Acetobacter okinawensis TaxID=1076594 RepID=UPI0039E94520